MDNCSWEKKVKTQLIKGKWEVIEFFDDGCGGANEVSHLKLDDGEEIIQKVMLGVAKYHQRRKALTEVVYHLLDRGIGGLLVVPEIFAEKWKTYKAYEGTWGRKNAEGHPRVCQVVRGYAPKLSGEDWRGYLLSQIRDLPTVDRLIRKTIETSKSAEKISLLDLLTINQDRSARNWVADENNFYAIDNGMAWFHQFPKSKGWQDGCVIDDVVLQKGPWHFISGVFATLWQGRELSVDLLEGVKNFDEKWFLREIAKACLKLGFPAGMENDWRFEGILRRLRWICKKGRLPTGEEYRSWKKGSKLFTPPEIVKTGGKIVWQLEWDRDIK